MRKTFVFLLLFVTAAVVVMAFREMKQRGEAKANTPSAVAAVTTNKVQPSGTLTNRPVRVAASTNTTRARPMASKRTNALSGNVRPNRNTPDATAPTVSKGATAGGDPAQLEAAYRASTNEVQQFLALDELSDRGDLTAMQTLDRLFQSEKNPEMKVEMLDSLSFYEGNIPYKLQMINAAAQASQPKEVRQAAIDALLDLDDPSAVPVLQPMKRDPDPEIRESAEDAIEYYQG